MDVFVWHDVGFQCARVSAQKNTMKFRKSTLIVIVIHTCHILPFQPILWNRYFPPEPAKRAKHSPKSISEGGRIWQVCNSNSDNNDNNNNNNSNMIIVIIIINSNSTVRSLTYIHIRSVFIISIARFQIERLKSWKLICCLFVRAVSNFKLPGSRPQKQICNFENWP